MEYKSLGRTGLPVSRICLGTMTFGVQCNEETSRAILDHATDLGIDFIDTADVYPMAADSVAGKGRTEEIIGRWLKGRRDEVVLATKGVGQMGAKPWQRGMSKLNLLNAIDASLRRLQVDHVDLYQLHGYDPSVPLDEALEALDAIVSSGKARYAGVSNWPATKVARALGRSEVRDLVRIDSVQPRYNLLFRVFERDLLPLCEEEGIGVIPYNPIAGGLLAGKHALTTKPADGSRFTLGAAGEMYRKRYWHDREFETVAALQPLAAQAGLPLTTLAVGWVLAQPPVTSAIIGASRPEQLADSVAAVGRPLDADLVAQADELTRQWRLGDQPR